MYREQVVRLGAQCTDYWTTEQSRGIGVPAVQLTTHVKSSTLYGRTVVRSYGRTVARSHGRTVVRSYGRTVVRSYGRTVVHPNFFGLMGYYYFV